MEFRSRIGSAHEECRDGAQRASEKIFWLFDRTPRKWRRQFLGAAGLLTLSGEEEAPVRLRYRASQFLSGLQPLGNHQLSIRECFLPGGAVCRAPRQLWHLRDKGSSLQYKTISYFVILFLPPFYNGRLRHALVSPGMVSPASRAAAD